MMISSRSPTGRRAMLAHRQAKEIALCTEGKLRVLTNLLSQHYPEQILIFTGDNATVYRISQDFLIPAITHQTPVKERHQILSKFRQGEYKTLVASHVLNEGVDVPDVRIAIILSGTASEREYIQRLGRVLRKGSQANKQAILYEVVTENTAEERTSQRRKGQNKYSVDRNQSQSQPQQLELLKYGKKAPPIKRAAESSRKWGEDHRKPSGNQEEE